MNAASDTVLLLDVDLGQVEELGVLVCKVVFHVSPGRSVEHVPHLEALDRLVLADKASAVSAADSLGAALVILRSTVVTSLRWHFLIIINLGATTILTRQPDALIQLNPKSALWGFGVLGQYLPNLTKAR